MQFSDLITTLGGLHQRLSQQAARQTDQLLTLRNYLFGFYIVEFEQHGTDRATYGEQLLKRLATELRSQAIKGVSDRSLRQYRQFYLAYPQIWQTASAKFNLPDFEQTRSPKTPSSKPDQQAIPQLDPALLLDRLTYSHFVELVKVDNPLLRRFYEVEALKNNWKVHELNRAITTLLAERTSLSTDKAAVIARIQQNQPATEDLIRSPYLLEFLGLEEKPAYTENDLETAIIDHLQGFLLELGRGFCFEARQKRISFGNRHYRIDLVFYHRILKCHVLVDLKIGEFDHADAGQMMVYLNYYKANEMSAGDNPPVGLILCASKDNALVEYATSGMSHELFVSQYLAELPDKEQLKALIERESQSL